MDTRCGYCGKPLQGQQFQPGQSGFCGDGCAALGAGPSFFLRRFPSAQTLYVREPASDFFTEPTSKSIDPNQGAASFPSIESIDGVTWAKLRTPNDKE